MPKYLGDAYVVISPDTDGFRPLLEVKVREALAGIDPKVPVGLSIDRNALGQFLSATQRAANIKVNVETDQAAASIVALRERIAALSQLVADIPITADDTQALATVAKLQGQIAALAAKLSDLQLNADSTALTAKIAAIQAQQAHLAAALENMEADVDINSALAKLAALKAQEDLLTKQAENIRIGISTEGLGAVEAQLLGLVAASDKFRDSLSGEALTGLAASKAAIAAGDGLAKLDSATRTATNSTAAFTRGTGGWIGGLLTAQVALFGGVTAVTGFHIALDALIEAGAIIVPALATAAAGLGAFAIAGSDSARQVYQMVTAIHTVGDAMNATIPPMTGKLEALHDQVRPQVWQIYGDAIDIVHTKTGLFNNLATQTGSVLDTLAARITVIAKSSGPGLTTFLDAGKRDLAQLGQIVLSVGDAFGKLIKITQETHIADYLLDIVGAGAKLLDLITKLPIPLLAVVVGLHGLYLWGGLATTGVLNLVGAITRMTASAAGVKIADTALGDLAANGNGLEKLSANASILGASIKNLPDRITSLGSALLKIGTNPWAWAAVAVAGLTALVIWTLNAKDATDKWITSSQKIVDSANLYTAVNVTASQLVATTGKLTDASTKLIGATGQIGPNLVQNAHDVQALSNYHQQLTETLGTEVTRISGVATQFGTTLPGAMALATFAGVKLSDLTSKQNVVWETAVQKIQGVVDGYKAMGQGSSQLGNDINVINVGASDQAKAITNLNSAWDAFIKVVGAPVDTFLTFSQTLVRFGNDATVAGAKMTGLGSGIEGVSKKVTNSSIQLQQDFQASFTAANQLFDAMRGSQAPADQQVKAVRDAVAALIPLAGTSKVAAAEISALAQEAGGPATTNLQTLKKWVGETGTQGMQGLQKDTNNAAIAMSNLSEDAAKLGSTLQSDLNAEMAKSIENAVGLQGAMDKYTKSLHDNGATAAETETDRKQLSDDLNAVFHNATQTSSVIKTLTGAFITNGDAADATKKYRTQIITDFLNASASSKSASNALNNYTAEVKANGTTSDAAKKLRQQLITDLINAGVQSKTANTDVTNYTAAVKANGVTSDGAKKARQQLITDILNASTNAKTGKTDLANYTTIIANNQTQTDAGKTARAKLITDLTSAGVNAKTATGLVNGLTSAIGKIPGSKSVTLFMTGTGQYSIQQTRTITSTGQVNTLGGHTKAAGGYISMGTGPTADDVPAWLSKGELVVPAHMVRSGEVDHLKGRLPGFAAGGLVQQGNASVLNGSAPGTDYSNFQTTMQNTLVTDMRASIKAAAAAAAAAANAAGGAYLGAGSANYAADISAVLKAFGLPASLLSNWLRQIATESGGNLDAVNRSDSNAAAGHPCVTLNTVILTRRGWLNWEDVQTGDETMGYNPVTQRSEWTRITGVHYYDSAEVWRIGNKRWHADVTPNHRWWSDTETVLSPENLTECPECGWAGRTDRAGLPAATPRSISTHRGRMHGVKPVATTSYRGEFVQTQDLGSHHRVRLAAPADTNGIPGLSLEDVRVIAWLQGDGSITPVLAKPQICPECNWTPGGNRKNRSPDQPANSVAVHRARVHGIGKGQTKGELAGYDGRIWQSKPEQIVKLRALLAHTDHTEINRGDRGRTGHLEAYCFLLRRAYVTDLLKRSQLMETGPEAFVLALSPDQRAAWLDSMIDAEGNRQIVESAGARRGGSGEFVRIAQVDGPLQEAIKLAVYLEGYRPTYARLARREAHHKPAGQIGMARPHIAPQMFTAHETLERQPVWCVTTELGTWTAEQNDGIPFLTGNSVGLLQLIPGTFAAYAGPYRNTPPLVNYGGGTVSENPMAQIYAAINYARSVYNGAGMAGVIGQGHGYALGGRVFDRGGTLAPGPNMVWNQTGRDEQLANVTGPGSRAHPSTPGHVAPHTPAEAEMISLLRQLVSVTGQQGAQFGNAINGASQGAAMRGRYNNRRG